MQNFCKSNYYFIMIQIINNKIPLYGICFFLGVVVATTLTFLLARKKGIDAFDFLAATAYILIGALIGAKLLFLMVSVKEIIRLKLTFLEMMKGGFVFYGGLIGGIAALWIYCKQYKLSFYKYADIIVLFLPLGHAFGRVGCLFAGCCYGMKYNGLCSVVYKDSYNVNTPLDTPLFPIQLMEAILLSFLFIVLFFCFRKHKEGLTYLVYLLSYSVIRFALEFFRGDIERGSLLFFSTSQWISLFIFLVSVFFWIRSRERDKRGE